MIKSTLYPAEPKTKRLRYVIIGSGEAGQKAVEKTVKDNPGAEIILFTQLSVNGALGEYPDVVVLEKEYAKTDLQNADFVIAVTGNAILNKKIQNEANALGKWVKLGDTEIKKHVENNSKKYRNLTFQIAVVFLAVFFGYSLSGFITFNEFSGFVQEIPVAFYIMLAVGFFAQLVDGAVGLGYGVTCSTSMMLFGVNLASISGSIHTAEMFSSAVSGYSHYKFGNVNKKLFLWLVIPGVIGAVAGSLLLIYLGDKYENIAYSIVSSYTFLIGIRLIYIAFKKDITKKPLNSTGPLGFAGGFFDAFGGGGWGPIVTSTLLAKGRKSKYVVGTVSLAEFFVTLTASLVFFSSLGVKYGYIVIGLILGGMLAAPIAARLAGRLPQKTAILAVAALVMISSLRVFIKFFG
jgi:uncharacterized membrane protein YfcA